jgi:hypothetical protein
VVAPSWLGLTIVGFIFIFVGPLVPVVGAVLVPIGWILLIVGAILGLLALLHISL